MISSTFRESIHARAGANPRRIVFPESTDDRILAAVVQLQRKALCTPVLVGDRAAIDARLARLGAAGTVEIVDPASDARRNDLAEALAARRQHRGWTREQADERLNDPLLFACMLVHAAHAHGVVAGAVSTTGDVIRAAIWAIGTAPNVSTVSSSFYMVVPPFRGTDVSEVLTFTDAAVVAEPTARELADIAASAAIARRRIVGDEPHVAFLSFSTAGSANSPSVTRVREAAALFRAENPGIVSDGELQADAALIADVAARKAPASAVPGTANVLVFPSLDAANIAYKLVQRLAAADALGPILQGLDRPCSDLSRGASVDDIVDVACVTALQAD